MTDINKLLNPVAPALPVGPTDYNRQYQDQLNNVLRLYFRQIDGVFSSFLNETGGRFVSLPCGSYFSNIAQTATANTATVLTLNNVDANATIATALSNGSIQVTYPGIYNYQFSAQLVNIDTKDWNVDIWVRVDGTNSLDSAGEITVPSKHGQGNGAVIAAWNFLVAAQANSVIDLVWVTPSTDVVLAYEPSISSPYARPAIPSVISTVTFVSRLPA
jgi:hypothetical protein